MSEYIINVKEGHGITRLEINSPVEDHEFTLTTVNVKLTDSQLKRLVKSIIEISENVLLAERGADFE